MLILVFYGEHLVLLDTVAEPNPAVDLNSVRHLEQYWFPHGANTYPQSRMLLMQSTAETCAQQPALSIPCDRGADKQVDQSDQDKGPWTIPG